MYNCYLINLCSYIIEFNVIISLLSIFVTAVMFYYSNINSKQTLIKDFNVLKFLKIILLGQLLISFITYLFIFYLYSYVLKKMTISVLCDAHFMRYYYSIPVDVFSYSLSIDIIGVIFAALAFFVGFISLIALDTRFYWNNIKFILVCNMLVLTIVVFTITNNFLIFFFMYELLLIPSFLFVYYISPGKQAIQASLYFVIWTQVGSFLVVLAVAYLLSLVGSTSFSAIRDFNFTFTEANIILFLLFFGFGCKVPIWPFHYWITKTHVEAPTGFSIFLSGFLVKSAIFGFYKFSTLIGTPINTTLFTTFCLMGVIDASLKMWGQTDLKKLVAYATIQEMGIIYLIFCWGDTMFIYSGVLFCITHAFLSSIFFFFVDCVYRRFNSRNIVEINGLLHITPNLGIFIIIGCILFSGLPGTMKFISEMYIFTGFLEAAPISTITVIVAANFLGIVGFSKVWYNVIFGLMPLKIKLIPKDLSFKEIYILVFCFISLLLYGLSLPFLH